MTDSSTAPAFDTARRDAFVERFLTDLAGAWSGVMTNVGHRLGLYRTLAETGPATAAELAERSGTNPRYVKEWLDSQAAGGYVIYHPGEGRYELPPEHAAVLVDGDSPTYLAPAFDVVAAGYDAEDRLLEAFRTGQGIGWHEHHHRLFCGVEAFFRAGYSAHLTSEWIPALDGVEAKLKAGARVADVGCGHGASTILMAKAYPESRFFGFDYHRESIETARQRAADAGVAERITFDVASAKDYPAAGYDLICFMDCLHDLGDPVGAAAHARASLADDGTVMLVEPFAGDRPEDNHNLVGRLYYSGSTALCTPNSLSQEVGLALGAQAGPAGLSQVMGEAGFSRCRRAMETPFNMILEARP